MKTRTYLMISLLATMLLYTACGASTTPLPPTPTPTAVPTNTPIPTATPSPTSALKPLDPDQIHIYPGPLHYAGDRLSVEAIFDAGHSGAELFLDGERLSWQPTDSTSPYGSDDDGTPIQHVLFQRVWNTSQQAGIHTLTLRVNDDGHPQEVSIDVEILPAEQRPLQEADAQWAQLETDCCTLYYITNTAAARDIEQIAEQVDASVEAIEGRLGQLTDRPHITFLDQVWGNGGYAGYTGPMVTYVDRDYTFATSAKLEAAIRHETTHRLTLPGPPNSILVEGIAVYLAGGHYQIEPIPERAAALLELDLYIPLSDLSRDFYAHQHEVAYLEAVGLVTYLVDTYNWGRFLQLYQLGPQARFGGELDPDWLNEALQKTYGVGLDEVEQGYIAWLESIPPGDQVDDLRFTIAYCDTYRRYQDLYTGGPMYGFLGPHPSTAGAMSRGIVAEYMREPTALENLVLEALLVAAHQAYLDGNYAPAEQLLDVINDTLDDGDFTRQPVAHYLAITQLLLEQGYEVQRIDLADTQATALAIRTWPGLETLTLEYDGTQWQIAD